MSKEAEKFLFRQKQLLTIMGHSLVPTNQKESIFKQIPQYFIIFVVFSCLYPISNYTIWNRSNINRVTAGLSIILIVILNTIKMATFVLNKAKFLEVMQQLKDMWSQNSNLVARKRLKDVNKLADRLVNLYFYALISSSIYFLFSPFGSLILGYITHRPFKKYRIAPMRFFFDTDNSPGYEILLFYTICVSLPVILNLIAVDGLFISFTANFCAHFDLLHQFIETNEFTQTNLRIKYDISSFVKYHTQILEVASIMYDAYKPIIFGQFLMTSLQVCVIAHQITKNMNNLVVMMTNICFLCTVLIQLLIYCYGGEIIKLKGLNIGTSIQVCKWYRLHPRHRKMMSLIMLRAQKPFIMRVAFYDASLASFMLIIKAASSYITLIQSLE